MVTETLLCIRSRSFAIKSATIELYNTFKFEPFCTHYDLVNIKMVHYFKTVPTYVYILDK